ncbi:hypothetical protein ACB092_02G201500 [Castanea dentata]
MLLKRPSSSRALRVVEAPHKFTSENPFFEVIIGSSFMERALKVMLQVGDKSWPVKLLIYPHLLSSQLSAGWFAFARDNGLQIGDVCVFELN